MTTLFSNGLQLRRSLGPCIAAILVAALPAGCETAFSVKQTKSNVASASGGIPKTHANDYRYPITPPLVDAERLLRFLQDFESRVVIVDLWASWSRRSTEELAMLADLHDELRDFGLGIIACNFDHPDRWAGGVRPILQRAGANFPCVVMPKGAREQLRNRLAPDWSYDLPARLILDRSGRVVFKAFSNTPITSVMAEARRLIADGRFETVSARDDAGESTLQAKLVNVATGEWESLPQAVARAGDSGRLAAQIVSYLAARLRETEDRRIAILAFTDEQGGKKAGRFGLEVASRIQKGLRRRRFSDVLGPNETKKLISLAGISAMAIDYDPAVTRGRLAADYLISGTVDVPHADRANRSVIAGNIEREESAEDEAAVRLSDGRSQAP